MKHSTRITSAFLAAALSAGVVAPAATAARPVDKGDKGHHAPSESADVKKVRALVARLDRDLARVAKDSRTSALNEEDRAVLTENIAADRATLSDIAASVVDSASAKAALASLKAMRPSNYTVNINFLRTVKKFVEEATLAAATVEPGSAEEAALVEAVEHLAAATAAAYLITATSTKADLKAISVELSLAKALIDGVNDDTDGDTDDDGTTP